MNEMRIGWNKIFSVIMMACGIFIVTTSFVIGPSFNTVTGVVIALVGGLALANPTVVITTDEVQMRNLLGMTLKRYPVQEVEMRNGALYHNQKKVTGFWILDTKSEDVASFLADVKG